VVVFGSAGVGKSSLALRFVKGTFKDSYLPTIEDTYRQVIQSNKLVVQLQITDTTGSHQFPAMQRLNIQKGHAFILVYSITNKNSLHELYPIYKDIYEIKGANEIRNVPIILVGSKCDEESARTVATSLGERLASDWCCAFIEVRL
jgi:small GTP-binding protein